MFPPRTLICAFRNFDFLKARYKKTRAVIADRYCPDDEFYYFARGHCRRVKITDWSIWAQIWEDGWPTMYQKRIR